MKNIIVLFVCFLSFSTATNAQELPRDLLDTNVAFIYDPSISKEAYPQTVQFFCKSIIKAGFNLTGKYLHTDTQTSIMEIEMDIKNKNIKYVFLLVDVPNKKPTHKLFLYKNSSENQNLVNPKVGIHSFKPNSKEALSREIVKIAKETKGYNIDIESYNQKLLNTFILKKQNLFLLKKINEINSVIDGSFLKIEHSNLPHDLESEHLAFIGSSKDEYKGYQTINSYFKNRMTNYPYNYQYFNSYRDYKKAGGDTKFKYRIQVCNKDTKFINELKESIKYADNIDDLKKESTEPYYGNIPNTIPRDHFSIVIKNNITHERHDVSDYSHIGLSIRNFNKKFKR